MVRVITQHTFDQVVMENMADFDISRQDAIQEAIEQFQTQGVDLSNIITESDGHEHVVVQSIRALESLDCCREEDRSEVLHHCLVLAQECSKGIAERILSTKENAYPILVSVADKAYQARDLEVQIASIKALSALMNGNPDPFNDKGYEVLTKAMRSTLYDGFLAYTIAFQVINGILLEPSGNAELVEATLGLILHCCVQHEQNRQNLVKSGLLDRLDGVFGDYPVHVARIWQNLVQDDDIRVPFGKAHEHAREIVDGHEAIKKIAALLFTSDQNQDRMTFLACLSSLCVRNEYCQAVVDNGGLPALLGFLMDPDQDRDVARETLKLIKVLAGNDNVKKDIRATEGLSIIVHCMSKHIKHKGICHAGSSAISAVCLRTPENAEQIVDAGGAKLLTQIMQIHMDNAALLTVCANAIRNVVCRSNHLCQDFLDHDAEQLLNKVRQRHPEAEDAAKGALRDLGLNVQLKEEWVAKGQSAPLIDKNTF